MESPKGQPKVEDWRYHLTSGYLEDALIQFSFGFSPPSSVSSASSSESKSLEEVTSIPEEEEGYEKRRTKRVRVAYPFALVKPGGVDDDLTLEDINKRTMRAPSIAVRHPVGDYACPPCVQSPHGPGLSGKPVVALTRIHTQGTGTITIVRTKD